MSSKRKTPWDEWQALPEDLRTKVIGELHDAAMLWTHGAKFRDGLSGGFRAASRGAKIAASVLSSPPPARSDGALDKIVAAKDAAIDLAHAYAKYRTAKEGMLGVDPKWYAALERAWRRYAATVAPAPSRSARARRGASA